MNALLFSALGFIGLHLLVSGTRLRDRLVGLLGEPVYLGLFALSSLGALIAMVWSYNGVVDGPENVTYWAAPAGLLHSGGIILLIAFLLGVIGLLSPTPTAAGGEKLLADGAAPAAKGIVRITRHPFLWGTAIWAGFHMAANGDRASQLFFGTFLIVALVGTRAIDAKRRRALGAQWDAFAAKTSNLPFAAVLSGRTGLGLGEIGLWRIAVALALWAGLFYGHFWLFSVSPVPGGWTLY